MNIAIVGGGLIGSTLSLDLALSGHHLELFEKQELPSKQSAAWNAAAMLAPNTESVHATKTVVQMGKSSLELWPKLLKYLKVKADFQQSGCILVYHHLDNSEASNFCNQLQRSHTTATVYKQSQLQEIEPALAHFQQGLFFADEGHLCNRTLLTNIAQSIHHHPNIKITTQHLNTSNISNMKASFDYIVDCRGSGAVTEQDKLYCVRGEVLRVYAPDIHLTRPVRLLHPRYPLYVAPKSNNIFVVGATEIEASDDSHISVRSTMEMLSALYTINKAFAEARILETSTALRACFPNHNPSIQVQDNIISVNGLYRHGFMILPALLQEIQSVLFSTTKKYPDIHAHLH